MQAHALFYRYSADESRPPGVRQTCVLSSRSLERRVFESWFRAAVFAGLILYSIVCANSSTAEVIVQNGVIPPLGVRMPALRVGDRMAARLTAPVDGTIVGVQLFWGSESGTAAPVPATAIHISTSVPPGPHDDYPVPGAVLATIAAPTLIDGGPNEFRYLDPGTNVLPLSVAVVAGQDFFVDLENAVAFAALTPSTPSLYFSDQNPADYQRNLIHIEETNTNLYPDWFPVGIGVSRAGDWGIRAIIQPVPEPSTYALAAIGAVTLLAVRRRKRPLSLN
jgi:hypothetical protein